MSVDTKAPVHATATATSTHEADVVWSRIADVANWSAIYPELKDVEVDGPIAPGTAFRFKTGPGVINATIDEVVEGSRLVFSGKGMGASSTYAFDVTATDGGCTIAAAQSMSGMAVRTMKKMLQGIAESSLKDWTEALAR